MYSIEDVRKANANYAAELSKLNALNESVKKVNDNLDLSEVNSKLTYNESKELYLSLLGRCTNKELLAELKNILNTKKVEEYPQITDVHYYPIINNIDFLSQEKKIKLDNLIKDAYSTRNKREEINNLDSDIIDFLVENSLLEKLYVFHCTCGSFEYDDKLISQERFDKLKVYWEKSINDETTQQEDREMNYGCFETGCWNDGTVEVCSLEDFNKYLIRTEYRVKIKPDMTLDNI